MHGIEIEGSDEIGVECSIPGRIRRAAIHEHTHDIDAVLHRQVPGHERSSSRSSSTPRTTSPKDDHNFLRDWKNGTYPAGWDNKPVTWVSLEDARAYAKWAGKRLPHEWEWQYAAQGTDGASTRGATNGMPTAVPAPDTRPHHARARPWMRIPRRQPVRREDLVGNVWQWTDEFTDEHTRAGILRGGSHYQPQGSHLVFPAGLPQRRARKVSADGAQQGSLRRGGLPLREDAE